MSRSLEEILEAEKPEVVEAAQIKAERVIKEIDSAEDHGGGQEDDLSHPTIS